MYKPEMTDELTISPWVKKWVFLTNPSGEILDVACGRGRHSKYCLEAGYRVIAVDSDRVKLQCLSGLNGITTLCHDLERDLWPFEKLRFQGVIVTNYLHRELMANISLSLARSGVLIYETFAEGNEDFGKPTNKDFLLKSNELLHYFEPDFHIVSYQQGLISKPKKAIIQRLCAIKYPVTPREINL